MNLSFNIHRNFYPENSFSDFCYGCDDNYFFNCTDSISTSLNADLGNIRQKYTAHPQTGETQPLEETEERGSRTPLKNKQGREQNHYYPFGLTHDGYQPRHDIIGLGSPGSNVTIIPTSPNVGDPYKYKYQGQERQDDFGLNWDSFKWRNYDYAIGRFFNIDPLAEDYVHNSTYAFAENKVIDHVELEGLEGVPTKTVQQWNGAFKKFGQDVLSGIDGIGAKASAFFASVTNIGSNTTVETTTTATAKPNLYNYVMDKQYSDQTSTTSPFKLEVETVTEIKTTKEVKTKVEGVDVILENTASTDVNNGEINNELKAIIGNGKSGAFVSNNTNTKTKENTTRVGVQVEAETPTIGNKSFKVGASFLRWSS